MYQLRNQLDTRWQRLLQHQTHRDAPVSSPPVSGQATKHMHNQRRNIYNRVSIRLPSVEDDDNLLVPHARATLTSSSRQSVQQRDYSPLEEEDYNSRHFNRVYFPVSLSALLEGRLNDLLSSRNNGPAIHGHEPLPRKVVKVAQSHGRCQAALPLLRHLSAQAPRVRETAQAALARYQKPGGLTQAKELLEEAADLGDMVSAWNVLYLGEQNGVGALPFLPASAESIDDDGAGADAVRLLSSSSSSVSTVPSEAPRVSDSYPRDTIVVSLQIPTALSTSSSQSSASSLTAVMDNDDASDAVAVSDAAEQQPVEVTVAVDVVTFQQRLHNQRRSELVAHGSLSALTQSHSSIAGDVEAAAHAGDTCESSSPALSCSSNRDDQAVAHQRWLQHRHLLVAAEQGSLSAILQLATLYLDEHSALTTSLFSTATSSKTTMLHHQLQLQQWRSKARALALWAWHLETGGVSLSFLGYHHTTHRPVNPPQSATGSWTDRWLDWMLGRGYRATGTSAWTKSDHVVVSGSDRWYGSYGVAPLLLLVRIECLEMMQYLLYSSSSSTVTPTATATVAP